MMRLLAASVFRAAPILALCTRCSGPEFEPTREMR